MYEFLLFAWGVLGVVQFFRLNTEFFGDDSEVVLSCWSQ